MSLQLAVPWLVVAMLTSIAGMVMAARFDFASALVFCAAIFVTWTIAVAVRANLGALQTRLPAYATVAAQRNARLSALVYAWAALSLYLLYVAPLTGIAWRHGWQYGTGSALLAAGAFVFALCLDDTRRLALARLLARLVVPLSAVQGLLAAFGFVYLIASGKLASERADWIAHVVLAGASIAITVVSALALRTHLRLARTVSGA